MLIEKVIKEILAVKNINIKKQFGADAFEFYKNFIHTSKQVRNETIYYRYTTTFRKMATMLDVPVAFIISIIKLERVEEIETITNN